MLAKRKTTKEKLAVWLETVCCILDQYVIPWLEKAAPLSDEVEKLNSEKIDDQKTVISLQNKLIEAHEKNVESVQNVVETTVETRNRNEDLCFSCDKELLISPGTQEDCNSLQEGESQRGEKPKHYDLRYGGVTVGKCLGEC